MAPVSRLWATLKATRPFVMRQRQQADAFVRQKWTTLQTKPPILQGTRANAYIKWRWTKFEQTTPLFVKDFLRYVLICLTWAPVVMYVNNYVFEIVKIRGPSMSPFFNERYNETTRRDVCFSWKRHVHENLERGMIVTFYNPLKPEALTTKRIIALPGDLIQGTKPPFSNSYIRVPPHHVWVEGDGGGDLSLDSNTYGPISIRLIQGRLTHILWPFHKAGRIEWREHPDRLAAFRE